MRRGVYIQRSRGQSKERIALGMEHLSRNVQCLQCKAAFPDYMGACPECGSEERVGLAEVNPYARMPMESFLKICGHVFWLVGVFAFIIIIWQTNTVARATSLLFLYGALFVLVSGVIMSAAYFALSELLRRILRIQHRLRSFHETYRRAQPSKRAYALPRSMPSRRERCKK